MTDVANSTDTVRLKAYLHAHWVGASAGLSTFRRAAQAFPDPGGAAALAALAEDVAADRESLRELMASVGAAPSPPQTLAAQLVAQARRIKPDRLLAGAARAADVVELETLRMLLLGKSSGWEVLTLVAETDPRLDPGLLATLRARGDDQIERITELHRAMVAERLLRVAR